jgi:hypothetical protein
MAAGSTMNLLVNIGIYGTLCKELGLEFRQVNPQLPQVSVSVIHTAAAGPPFHLCVWRLMRGAKPSSCLESLPLSS